MVYKAYGYFNKMIILQEKLIYSKIQNILFMKELTRNEKNFRRYLKKYHPDKYEELIWLDSIQK